MVDIYSAYIKAKKVVNKYGETFLSEICYYLELDDNYLFLSCENEDYQDGYVVSVNKKGGKTNVTSYYNFCLIKHEIKFCELNPISNINEEKKEFDSSILEKRETIEISNRDLVFNLIEKDIPIKSILKIDNKGITLNNITHMSLSDFASIYGQAREKIYLALKDLSENITLNLNDISIYVLTRFGLSEVLCDSLNDIGIDKLFKLYLLPEEFFAAEYNFLDATIEKFYTALNVTGFKLIVDEKVENYIKSIENNENYKKCVMSEIQSKISRYPEGVKLFTLKRLIDERFIKCSLIDQLIHEMIVKKIIKLNEIGLVANELSIKDYLNYLPDSPNNKLLKRYILDNETYETLGNELGVSRQRVEQIFNKFQLPNLFEDRYVEFYKRYLVYGNDFCAILGVEPYVYKYLSFKYKKNKNQLSLETLLEDENVPEYVQKNLEKLYRDSYVFIDGEKVPKTKKMLVTYYMKHNVHEFTKLSNIIEGFKKFIENYVQDYNKSIKDKDIRNVLLDESIPVLSCSESKFKYFDIYNNDLTLFVEKLNLDQFIDVEISTLYLYDLYKDLMDEYNIENEYVLHNLLRKLHKNQDNNMVFKKPPYIVFGNGNRDKQIDDLILELAPIKVQDFVREYSKRYGTNEGTILNFVEINYKEIINNHYLTLENIKLLTTDEINIIKTFINDKELIFKEDLNEKFLELGLDKHVLFSRKNMELIGFVSNSNYIYSNKYSSMTEYLEKNYFNMDIIETSKIDKRLYCSSIFGEMLNNKRKEMKLIEFENGKFMNVNILSKIGVEEKNLKDFVDKVHHFTLGKGIFTLKSIVNQGFEHELLELGFEDMFYSSILRSDTSLNYKRVKNIIIFENSNIKHEISIANILEEVLLRYRKMDEYDLAEYLNDNYGIDYSVNIWDLQKYAKETNIYYDKYTDTYYYNYDVYFEEV